MTLELLRRRAPWLLDPELGTCVVGSHALAEACKRAGVPGPDPRDLDLAWALDVESGRALLEDKGVLLQTTPANVARGTLALKLGDQRIEVTTFRAGDSDAPLRQRIEADLRARDMTVGALAYWPAEDEVLDPTCGLQHWMARTVVPVGDPKVRILEHPVRWLRYYRKAHEWAFALDRSVRKVDLDPEVLDGVPPEALAAELRTALARCASPGRFFHELHEAGLLAHLTPELDRQFDGRPAGPARHHPEIGQALHMILVLEWAAARTGHLPEQDKLAVMIAALCHDLGKSYTPTETLPAHRGHERSGLRHVKRLLDRFPGLADQRARSLALQVCALHLDARHLRNLRPGTLARYYDEHFRRAGFPVELFALAVGADVGGRLGLAAEGDRMTEQITADLHWIRERCSGIDASELRRRHKQVEDFKRALHEARARVLR